MIATKDSPATKATETAVNSKPHKFKMAVYYEDLEDAVKKIGQICQDNGIEYAMMFRTDENEDGLNSSPAISYCVPTAEAPNALSEKTVLVFTEFLIRRQKGAFV